jgi:hypothetical protein
MDLDDQDCAGARYHNRALKGGIPEAREVLDRTDGVGGDPARQQGDRLIRCAGSPGGAAPAAASSDEVKQ